MPLFSVETMFGMQHTIDSIDLDNQFSVISLHVDVGSRHIYTHTLSGSMESH
jgi:hypothetical protein